MESSLSLRFQRKISSISHRLHRCCFSTWHVPDPCACKADHLHSNLAHHKPPHQVHRVIWHQDVHNACERVPHQHDPLQQSHVSALLQNASDRLPSKRLVLLPPSTMLTMLDDRRPSIKSQALPSMPPSTTSSMMENRRSPTKSHVPLSSTTLLTAIDEEPCTPAVDNSVDVDRSSTINQERNSPPSLSTIPNEN
jgi:hypothetical protein